MTDRVERAATYLSAVAIGDDRYAYRADETRSWWVVDAEDMAELCDYLDDTDDGYSRWCAETPADEMPEGWEPGQETDR